MDEAEQSKTKERKMVIATRGIPADDSFYLPRHDSPELKRFQDENETITRNVWGVGELANFVFPKRYRQKYHEVALAFLNTLGEKTELSGSEIAAFVSANNFSKATFYNKVLLRLKRAGLVKVERLTVTMEGKKFRPMKVSISKTFGNYLMKIADSWLAYVDDSRERKRKQEKLTDY
ncbi:hypothetical protein COT30_04835 [Candidatus Micrarchaeota archaeon CG08_land_8_20_14_0_20_49_17]|nr:MAG: hypothetical protein AUJ13_00090 [Candidatus Micrarchaeota archaeon CG1_02_49_24]PIU09353.1 MAG: hypothetical protein COT30_04835 [Candidatus Micrarchaeota archaeon CG08_land_8_20_14_0_20_49_17]PIZ95317.1 MAG: hypothetical protein COX84_04550 [Candidatus Micrarchaeota archaeon CG_4_10_14_0_2_um_filter_49_7]HII53508.1 Rrf2 family transcriptional regulator [Candidatus Micrarchaeota archaeon]